MSKTAIGETDRPPCHHPMSKTAKVVGCDRWGKIRLKKMTICKMGVLHLTKADASHCDAMVEEAFKEKLKAIEGVA